MPTKKKVAKKTTKKSKSVRLESEEFLAFDKSVDDAVQAFIRAGGTFTEVAVALGVSFMSAKMMSNLGH